MIFGLSETQKLIRRSNVTFFFLLALQPPSGVVHVFYSPLEGFSLLAYEVS